MNGRCRSVIAEVDTNFKTIPPGSSSVKARIISVSAFLVIELPSSEL